MAIYCMQCGKELPDDAIFCLKCGKPVEQASTPSQNDDVVNALMARLQTLDRLHETTRRTPTPSETRWEYCEIVCVRAGFLGGKSYFAAQAVGNKGRYEATRSIKVFQSEETTRGIQPNIAVFGGEKKAQAALDEVMATLSTDGWELTGQKGQWWEYKYLRRERS